MLTQIYVTIWHQQATKIQIILHDSECKMAAIFKFQCVNYLPQCHIHVYASVNQVSIGWDNGLSPIQHQAIIWTYAGMLLIAPLGTNFSEILIEIQTFSRKKMHLKMSSGKYLFRLHLNVIYGQCVTWKSISTNTIPWSNPTLISPLDHCTLSNRSHTWFHKLVTNTSNLN